MWQHPAWQINLNLNFARYMEHIAGALLAPHTRNAMQVLYLQRCAGNSNLQGNLLHWHWHCCMRPQAMDLPHLLRPNNCHCVLSLLFEYRTLQMEHKGVFFLDCGLNINCRLCRLNSWAALSNGGYDLHFYGDGDLVGSPTSSSMIMLTCKTLHPFVVWTQM